MKNDLSRPAASASSPPSWLPRAHARASMFTINWYFKTRPVDKTRIHLSHQIRTPSSPPRRRPSGGLRKVYPSRRPSGNKWRFDGAGYGELLYGIPNSRTGIDLFTEENNGSNEIVLYVRVDGLASQSNSRPASSPYRPSGCPETAVCSVIFNFKIFPLSVSSWRVYCITDGVIYAGSTKLQVVLQDQSGIFFVFFLKTHV